MGAKKVNKLNGSVFGKRIYLWVFLEFKKTILFFQEKKNKGFADLFLGS